jgi:endonuclease/exonuclease/phosphatase family metal-dependent hydrolase
MNGSTMNRKEFLASGACISSFTLLKGCRAFLPGESSDSKAVRFGVISDTHVTGDESADRLRPALEFFVREKVDAVLHCGDVTNLGYLREYAAFRRVWDAVMPKSIAFVSALGNRDLSMTAKMPEEVRSRDAALLVASSSLGKSAGIHVHEVRGIPVVAIDWGYEDGLEQFMSERPELRRMDRPLVVVQHRHMAGTVYNASPGSWMADSGRGACYLRMFPNAVSFSGHSHVRFREPNGIWHGDFTAAGAGSCYVGPPDAKGGYEVSVLELQGADISLLRRDLKTGYEERHHFTRPPKSDLLCRKPGVFTFAQWNLGHFAHGRATSSKITAADGARRSLAYRSLLERVRPDMLGLCEYSAAFDAGGTQTRSALFGDYPAFTVGPADGFQCNAIASRTSLCETRFADYSKRRQKTYYALSETVVGGVPVTVVETHLDLSREERRQQIAELAAAISGRERVIVSGDFNIDDQSEYGPLLKAGLVPANGGDFGLFNTHRRRRMEITPAIDNVLVRGLSICGVATADDELELSDHRMLVVQFRL